MSLRFRLATFGAGVVAASLLVFGFLVYQLAAASATSDQDQALRQQARETVVALRRISPSDLGGAGGAPALGAVDLASSTQPFVEVLSSAGKPLSSTGQIAGLIPAVPAAVLTDAARSGSALATVKEADTVELRVCVMPWSSPSGSGGFVVAGQRTSIKASNLTGLVFFLGISAVPALLGALGASWLVARRALKPLRTVVQTADAIGSTHDLGRRLEEKRGRDEIALLSRSFNGMLQHLEQAQRQLEAALVAQRRLVADASHELRTPLTTIHGNAGLLALGQNVPAEDRRAAERAILQESERMKRLVEHMLTLARADAGSEHLVLQPVDLTTVVEDVCGQVRALHPDHQLELQAAGDVRVRGEEDSLRQLLWILLDNALKFGDPGGHVQVRLTQREGKVVLAVKDDGSGIPEPELERVFERFFRTDSARSGGGAGLGLSIGLWIVQEHGGSINVRNNLDRGCTFTVELPALSPAGISSA